MGNAPLRGCKCGSVFPLRCNNRANTAIASRPTMTSTLSPIPNPPCTQNGWSEKEHKKQQNVYKLLPRIYILTRWQQQQIYQSATTRAYMRRGMLFELLKLIAAFVLTRRTFCIKNCITGLQNGHPNYDGFT